MVKEVTVTKKKLPEGIRKQRRKLNHLAEEKLFELIAKIRSPEQVRAFFKDLLSSSEIYDLTRRLLAAEFLYYGRSYSEINLLAGLSPNTINKVHFKTKGSKVLPDLFKSSKKLPFDP